MLSRFVVSRLLVLLRVLGARVVSGVTTVALVAGLLTVATVTTITAAPQAAAAAPVAGDGGLFVPAAGSLLNAALSAGTWRQITVAGVAGIPVSGVSAVAVNISIDSPVGSGVVRIAPVTGNPPPLVTALSYSPATGRVSSASMVAVGSTGKIQVWANTAETVAVTVQGYFTAGTSTAAGGFATVTPNTMVSTTSGVGVPVGKFSPGTQKTIQVTGTSGVPTGASAVFVNVTAQSYSNTDTEAISVWPTDQSRPAATLNIAANTTITVGTTLPLSSDGKFNLQLRGVGGGSDIQMTVIGYYAPGNTAGAFTPVQTRVYDGISTNTLLANGSTTTVPVAGIRGVPVAGAGISAVVISVEAQNMSTTACSGNMRLWPGDQPEPGSIPQLQVKFNTKRNTLVILPTGADGTIKIHNTLCGNARVALDVQGWFSNVAGAVPANQTRTQKRVTLQAGGHGGNFVTYSYRKGITGSFSNVPVADVTIPGTTAHPGGWPVTINSGGTFDPFTWDLAATVGGGDQLVQVRACYGTSSTAPASGLLCSMPSNVQLATHAFGDSYATTEVGPGTLAQLTGDLQITQPDVTVGSYLGSLTVGRTFENDKSIWPHCAGLIWPHPRWFLVVRPGVGRAGGGWSGGGLRGGGLFAVGSGGA